MRTLLVPLVPLLTFACTSNNPLPSPSDAGTLSDAAPVADAGPCPTAVAPGAGIVFTGTGPVQCVEAGAAWKFLGLPFAAPPVGALRWKAPAPAACQPALRLADHFASQCPQLDANDAFAGAEDCLYLNVWTPKAAPPQGGRPVMFFIHGGGHTQGAASVEVTAGVPLYDGQRYAEQYGAVVVTINYRLGVLGWLAHPALAAESKDGLEGNYGTLDQIAALQWVQRNIAGFGGDPKRVMIFGESAGGVAVCALLATPLAKGLFSTALIESGGCVALAKARAEELGAKVAQGAKCDAAPDVPACLRALSAEAAVRAFPVKVDVAGIAAYQYDSVIDGYVHAEAPLPLIARGAHNHAPLVVGVNAEETSRTAPAITSEAQYQLIVLGLVGGNQPLANAILAEYPAANYPTPRAAYVALSTDAKFICPARAIARAAAAGQTEPVYRYLFAQAVDGSPALKPFGAYHALELLWVFHVLNVAGYVPSMGELALSDLMQAYWSRFAALGDPNDAKGGAPVWPRYEAKTDPYLKLKADATSAEAGLRTAKCDFWDQLR